MIYYFGQKIKLPTIRICDSSDGVFLRAQCERGERDITPDSSCDFDDCDSVRFEVIQDLAGAWGGDTDWFHATVIDEREFK